ncbi:MAG: Amuc_1099 family pilus-like system protein, partial [Verrucomicrobiota bacterium]
PAQSTLRERNMMVSEIRVSSINPGNKPYPIPFHAKNCPFTGHPQPIIDNYDQDGDGMSDKFEKKHGLDHLDAADALGDADNDSYTNIEEHRAGTSPSDPNEFPPPVEKLRLARVKVVPFQLLFQGMNELPGSTNYVLNSRITGKTYFVKMNEEVLGGYKLHEFKKVERLNASNINIDESELYLKKGEKVIKLIKNKEFSQDDKIGLLVWLGDGSRYQIRPGRPFDLMGKSYNVVDIIRNTALIRDAETGENIKVPKWTKAEYEKLSGGLESRKKSDSAGADSYEQWKKEVEAKQRSSKQR